MDLTWLGAILVGASCLALGYIIGIRHRKGLFISARVAKDSSHNSGSKKNNGKEPLEIEKLADIVEDFKMVALSCSVAHTHAHTLSLRCKNDVFYALFLKLFMQVLVVRNDLKMGKGKIAAQCSHATLGLYKKLLHRAPKALKRWEMCAQPKVVVRIESEEDMLVLQERGKSLKLPTHITIDAGRTQIAPNSRTVMAILGPVELVDDVTGGLKLL